MEAHDMTVTPVVILVNKKLTMNSRLCVFSIGLSKKQTTGRFFFSLKFLFLGFMTWPQPQDPPGNVLRFFPDSGITNVSIIQ